MGQKVLGLIHPEPLSHCGPYHPTKGDSSTMAQVAWMGPRFDPRQYLFIYLSQWWLKNSHIQAHEVYFHWLVVTTPSFG